MIPPGPSADLTLDLSISPPWLLSSRLFPSTLLFVVELALMRRSSSSLSSLYRAHRNSSKSLAAADQLHCTCSRSVKSNRSSQTARSSHSTASSSLPPDFSDYYLNFLYPKPRRRLYSTRQQQGDDSDAGETPEASTSKLEQPTHPDKTVQSHSEQEKAEDQRTVERNLKRLIALPLTTENFPIPTHSKAPELNLLFSHEEDIYKAYKEFISVNISDTTLTFRIALHFEVARYLLDFAQFVGLNFSRIQLRKAELLTRRLAAILSKNVIPQLEMLTARLPNQPIVLASSTTFGDGGPLKSAQDSSKFQIECLRVETLMISGMESEALTLLDSLLESQTLVKHSEHETMISQRASLERQPQVRTPLSRSILTILSTYELASRFPWRERPPGTNYTGFKLEKESRSISAVYPDPESVASHKGRTRAAERSLSWFFSRAELILFNHQSFKQIYQIIKELLEDLKDPLGFFKGIYEINLRQINRTNDEQASRRFQNAERLRVNLTNLTVSFLRVDLPLAHEAWKFMFAKGLPLMEATTRSLIKSASNSVYQGKSSMIENLHHLALQQKPGSGLEASTYLMMCKHCARSGDQVGLENHVRRLEAHHGKQIISSNSDSLHAWRCLASSVSGDVDRLLRLLDRRFILEQILPLKEKENIAGMERQTDGEEVPQKRPMDGTHSTLLIRCYVKAGDVDSAEEVYDNMKILKLDIPPSAHNLLLSGYARKVNVPAALSLVDEMRSQGIKLSENGYICLIRLFAFRKDPESAERVIETMKKEGLEIKIGIQLALLNAYVESGSWNRAVSYFEEMDKRRQEKHWHFRLPDQAYAIILKAYVLSASPIQDVMKFVYNLVQDGFNLNAHSFTLLLTSATDAGAMEVAERIFDLAERHLASIERVEMSGGRLAIDDSRDVELDGIEEDRHLDDLLEHDSASSANGTDWDSDDFGRASSHHSRRAITQGEGANVYHFTIMINAYLRLGQSEIAKQYLAEMRKRGIKLTSVTYGSLVASYVKTGTETNAALAKEMIASLRSFELDNLNDSPRSDLDYRTSLDAQIIHQTNTTDTNNWDPTDFETLYSPLLQSYAKLGEVAKAEDVLKEMALIGIKGSIRTLTNFLDANRRAGDVEACMNVWDNIYSRALAETNFDTNIASSGSDHKTNLTQALDPSRRNFLCLPLSIIMDILQDDDFHKNEIPRIWSQMREDGFGFDAHNYNSLARSLIKADRIDNAMRICEDILKDELYEEVKERKLVQLQERKDKKASRLSADLAKKRSSIVDSSESVAGTENEHMRSVNSQAAMRSQQSDEMTVHDEEIDFVESPSRPPNRRSQNRFQDDIDEIPSIGEVTRNSRADSSTKPKSETSAKPDLLGPLKDRAHELSQWFPHFETLKLMNSYLDNLDRENETVILEDPDQDHGASSPTQRFTVNDLLRRYPRTAENLRRHRIKVEAIEARYRADAERDQG